MYQPVMTDAVIRTLYRVKRAHQRPMTKILDEVVARGFAGLDAEAICSVCSKEGNNADCQGCYLRRG